MPKNVDPVITAETAIAAAVSLLTDATGKRVTQILLTDYGDAYMVEVLQEGAL
jgi:hypothetical protein